MNDQIKQIAERLRGLRDVLELTSEDIARDCDISAEEYRLAETGQYDISVSMLQKIARTYNIALDTLMFGEEPKMSSYFVTRAGKGVSKMCIRDRSAGEMLRNNGFISLQFSGNIAVIRTRPGYASSMAYDIDNNEFSEILGTIAGDDTIMLVLREGVATSKVRQLLSLIIPNIE